MAKRASPGSGEWQAVLAGMLDAIVELRETRDALDAWDGQLGVSEKAKRLANADVELRRLTGRPQSKKRVLAAASTRAEALEAFEAATCGRDRWESGLLTAAGKLLRDLGLKVGDPTFSALAFNLVERFIRRAADAGNWPIPSEPVDLSPPIGRRFGTMVMIPAHVSVWSVKRFFLPQLAAEVRDIRRTIKSVQKAAKRRGRPPDLAAQRRNGRWYFLRETRRADAEALARPYHKGRGDEHVKEHGEDLCEDCVRHVHRSLERARELIEGT